MLRLRLTGGSFNEAVPESELDAAIDRKTGEIVSKSAAAIRYGKTMFYRQKHMETWRWPTNTRAMSWHGT